MWHSIQRFFYDLFPIFCCTRIAFWVESSSLRARGVYLWSYSMWFVLDIWHVGRKAFTVTCLSSDQKALWLFVYPLEKFQVFPFDTFSCCTVGLYITYSTLIVRLLPDESADDISVACQAVNPETNEISRTSAAIKLFPKSGVRHPALSNRFSVYDAAGNELEAVNGTDLEAIQTGTKSDNFAMIVAVSASVSCAVFFTILGCLLYVVIRGRGKKFEGNFLEWSRHGNVGQGWYHGVALDQISPACANLTLMLCKQIWIAKCEW